MLLSSPAIGFRLPVPTAGCSIALGVKPWEQESEALAGYSQTKREIKRRTKLFDPCYTVTVRQLKVRLVTCLLLGQKLKKSQCPHTLPGFGSQHLHSSYALSPPRHSGKYPVPLQHF